jgi:Uma2 family endonuclease
MLSSPLMLQMLSSITDEQFFEFCQLNRDLRIERNQFAEISIMPIVDSETGNREFHIIGQLGIWAEKDDAGIGFSSSAGFQLSTGAVSSPDAAWINLERWNTRTSEQQKKFAPICPDFVIELGSASDNLQPLKDKMLEYMQEPGIQLWLLIDRKNRQVYIYRPGEKEECLENPDVVSCDPILPGFVLQMGKIW